MRLKTIQVSGFKSFVDPTSIRLSSDVIGIVGPNGCGKSNVIDAVRWVMGELSAKNLRGDSMADVIFNGSTARKPVGKASVELVFDNSEGRAPGPYGQFAEISVKRSLGRDGTSEYFINNSQCRRRDITDIFLGTGLGPRSYSIIEQGMVGRVIEARPEELRAFVEEAAGISKYKDRRRDTETRIRHTRENLSRVQDIQSELETQLRRLKRQSQAARRYKELREEERRLQGELLSLRWQRLDARVREHDAAQSRLQTEHERTLAELRAVESDIERVRGEHDTAQERHNRVQGELYRVGAEIAGVEQRIEHVRETRESRERERGELAETLAGLQRQLDSDRHRVQNTETEISTSQPELQRSGHEAEAATAAVERAEGAYQEWQAAWERFGLEAAEPAQAREIERSRIEHLERHLEQLSARLTRQEEEVRRLDAELAQSDVAALKQRVDEQDRAHAECEAAIDGLDARAREQRRLVEETAHELEGRREQHQELAARLASLKQIQAAALGEHDETLVRFLQSRGLERLPRLAGAIRVSEGWERAVERVLGTKLAAVCVDDLDAFRGDAGMLTEAELYMVHAGADVAAGAATALPGLSEHVEAEGVDLASMLGGIYAVDDVERALELRAQLAAGECIVTRTGAVVGSNWLSFGRQPGARAGLLSRTHEIERLEAEVGVLDEEVGALRAQLERGRELLLALEDERAELSRELSASTQRRTELHNRLGREEARAGQAASRRSQVRAELEEIRAERNREAGEVEAAQRRLEAALDEVGTYGQHRDRLLDERERLRQDLERARAAANDARDTRHRVELEQQRLSSVLESAGESVTRLGTQIAELASRRAALDSLLEAGDEPQRQLQEELEALLAGRVEVEARLSEARESVSAYAARFRDFDELRMQHEQAVEQARGALEDKRLERQELHVRRETAEGRVSELGYTPEALLGELPEEAEEGAWEERVAKIARRIERLGPVNLVAIEEYEEQSQRKQYLDKQYQDLSDALETLEEVIRKIDRETRTRFRTTFDQLNEGFQSFFPKLFGGGSAYLELTDEDLLSAGVTVMARPPGKRNSTIHLLSGGEKALTAVSLLFAFFELTPAPFCILDEVDAPLDDANVERYCQTLRSMSERTQLIIVTHNKITMEVADVLLGVTMGEPGVSRLVSVDVQQAVEMAAQ